MTAKTIKETIIDALKRAGYDTMTACELASDKIKELKASEPGEYKFAAGDIVLAVRVGGKSTN